MKEQEPKPFYPKREVIEKFLGWDKKRLENYKLHPHQIEILLRDDLGGFLRELENNETKTP